MEDKTLTAQEAAGRLNVRPVTVRKWLKKGLFPNARLEEIPPFGEVWRIPESDVSNFIPPKTGRPKQEKEDKQ